MPFEDVRELVEAITKMTIAKDAWKYEIFEFCKWEKPLCPDCGDDMIWNFVKDIENRLK
jgi:hypothetical protein